MSFIANPKTGIEPPVNCYDLAQWVRGDSDDPIYNSILTMATSQVIEFLQLDLIQREWELIYQDWPVSNQTSTKNISKDRNYYDSRIALPYTNLISVENVYVDNELTSDYDILNTKWVELCFEHINISSDNPALKVEYTAGYGSVDDVPQVIKDGIILVAGFIYSNRGCTAQEAFKNSGAMALLQPYRVKGGIIL